VALTAILKVVSRVFAWCQKALNQYQFLCKRHPVLIKTIKSAMRFVLPILPSPPLNRVGAITKVVLPSEKGLKWPVSGNTYSNLKKRKCYSWLRGYTYKFRVPDSVKRTGAGRV
jgi:hypothetical protein